MEHLSMLGKQPLVSKQLADYMQADNDVEVSTQKDEFDRLIAAEDIQIVRFTFFRDLDLFLVILKNRRIISRRLSVYSYLEKAADQQLNDYVISKTGIHWPSIDADLSLRGFLLEETAKTIRAFSSSILQA